MPAERGSLDQPLYGATFLQAVSRFWRKDATFSGSTSLPWLATEVQTHFLPKTMAAMARPPPLTTSDAVLTAIAMNVSLIASVVLMIFDVSAPVPAGRRFDRPASSVG